MRFLRRDRSAGRPPTRTRTHGLPPSGNGASSFHLHWHMPASRSLVEVAATLEVIDRPAVARLYFWALQVSFSGGGAAHTGLQWLPARGGIPAVNWGGYRAEGGELDGSVSPLPSLDGNPNTRLHDWALGTPHRLRVLRGDEGWQATVDDVVIRELFAPGRHLAAPMVWSEVFAACDDPPVRVRWSDFEAITDDGSVVHPDGLAVTYQSYADGGCDNTDVVVDDIGVVQVTSTERLTPPGARIPWPPAPPLAGGGT